MKDFNWLSIAAELKAISQAGLFFAGEVINADGPSGGYNLQIAWSTGALAGKNAGQFCRTTP